jgi:hypothetical protein
MDHFFYWLLYKVILDKIFDYQYFCVFIAINKFNSYTKEPLHLE